MKIQNKLIVMIAVVVFLCVLGVLFLYFCRTPTNLEGNLPWEPLHETPEIFVSVPEKLAPQKLVLPDFSQVVDVQQRKQMFFNFLEPIVRLNNDSILKNRQVVTAILQKFQVVKQLNEKELRFLMKIEKQYQLAPLNLVDEQRFVKLLMRVDLIPPSLALIQAAIESAWGTSRFAKEGNNLFGQWCFKKGCGIIPQRRSKGGTYEAQAFPDISAAIGSYMHNLNTHRAYKKLRNIRFSLRQEAKNISGDALAQGLLHYSARGKIYVDEIRFMIKNNGLNRYDSVLQN